MVEIIKTDNHTSITLTGLQGRSEDVYEDALTELYFETGKELIIVLRDLNQDLLLGKLASTPNGTKITLEHDFGGKKVLAQYDIRDMLGINIIHKIPAQVGMNILKQSMVTSL